jgi:hypothetical protein
MTMKLGAAMFLFAWLSSPVAAQTICGRVTSEAEVHCIPNLRPFGTMFAMFPDSPHVQLWIRDDSPLSQTYFVRLVYMNGGIADVTYALLTTKAGVGFGSIPIPSLRPTRIDYWDVRRWQMRTIAL